MPESWSASVCSASRRRSVLKMLNSVSSAVNALPLSGVSSGSPVPPSSKPGAVDAAERVDGGAELLAIGGEVLHDLERRGERRDRDEIGRRQLLLDVVVRRHDRALDLLRLHRAQVEEQHDEAAAAHVDLHRRGGRRGRGVGGDGRPASAAARPASSCAVEHGIDLVELFEVEARDGLRLVVLGDREVVARQAADDRAVPVAHDDVHEDELGAGAKHLPRRRGRLRPRRRRDQHDQKQPQRSQRRRENVSLRARDSAVLRRHQNLNLVRSWMRRIGRTRRHLTEGRRVDDGVDRRELHGVEHVAGQHLESTGRASG